MENASMEERTETRSGIPTDDDNFKSVGEGRGSQQKRSIVIPPLLYPLSKIPSMCLSSLTDNLIPFKEMKMTNCRASQME